jgi:hypothetical protein
MTSNGLFDIDIPGYKPVEILLKDPDDFLKVRETLTRIEVASKRERVLYQSCHILHKQGKYYIVHFKELFALDGKQADMDDNDIERRNTIVKLLTDWGLITIIDKDAIVEQAPLSQIKIIAFKDKHTWELKAKYNIGKRRQD